MRGDLVLLMLGIVAVVLVSGCFTETGQVAEKGVQEQGAAGGAALSCADAGFSVRGMSFNKNLIEVHVLNTGQLELSISARVDYLDGDYESWDSIGALEAGEDRYLAITGVSINVESVSLSSVECPGLSRTLKARDIRGLPELYEGDFPEGGQAAGQDIRYGDYRCKGTIPCIYGTVDRVVDGDTLYIGGYLVRLALVDTPESDENGFAEANAFTESLCSPGSLAVFDIDDRMEEDRYGRFLAVVWCGGENLNERLLEEGHGKLMEHYCTRSEFGSEKWADKYGC
jgi:endonuclease YncB( thermonuclease family)